MFIPFDRMVGGSDNVLISALSASGTLTTVPKGRMFIGYVSLSAGLTTSKQVVNARPTVTVTGAGCFPVSGTVIAALAMITNIDTSYALALETQMPVFVLAGSSAALIVLTQDSASAVNATLCGRLL